MFSYKPNKPIPGDSEDYLKVEQLICTLNTSIVLNCFSLFEASMEWRLLQEISTKDLSGIQRKIVLKHIDHIIKISGYDGYMDEYRLLTGQNFKDFLNEKENEMLAVIKGYYVIRHILVHGSSSKLAMIPASNGGNWIRVDEDDKKYQEFLIILKNKIDIKVSNRNLNLNVISLINQVADLLVKATFTLANKLSDGKSGKLLN